MFLWEWRETLRQTLHFMAAYLAHHCKTCYHWDGVIKYIYIHVGVSRNGICFCIMRWHASLSSFFRNFWQHFRFPKWTTTWWMFVEDLPLYKLRLVLRRFISWADGGSQHDGGDGMDSYEHQLWMSSVWPLWGGSFDLLRLQKVT